MLPYRKLSVVSAFLLIAVLATPTLAGTLYKWTSEDGSVFFTDDLKRVPERYRGQVETRENVGLDSYERFTPEDAEAASSYRARLDARLERLRQANAPQRPAVALNSSALSTSETIVQVNDSTALRIPATASDAGPIVVEEVRVRRPGSLFTIHDTVVRQGDKVLLVVAPAQSHEAGPNDFIEESELFESR